MSAYPGDDWVKAYAPGAFDEITRLRARVAELVGKHKKIIAWLEKLAEQAERQAKDTRFISLAEANAADAKNYRAVIADIRTSLLPHPHPKRQSDE